MTYSLHLLKKNEEYQELLKFLNNHKEDARYNHMRQRRAYETMLKNAQVIQDELHNISKDIKTLQKSVRTIPACEVSANFQSRIIKLNHRKFLLKERTNRYNAISMLQKEFEITRIEKEQAAIEELISAITGQMGSLKPSTKMKEAQV